MKRLSNLTRFNNALPYASEVFGVYQGLLGWRSKRSEDRIKRGFASDQQMVLEQLRRSFLPRVRLEINADNILRNVEQLEPGVTFRPPNHDMVLMQQIAEMLPSAEAYRPDIWDKVLSNQNMEELLGKKVPDWYLAWYKEHWAQLRRPGDEPRDPAREFVEIQLRRESSTAGLLLALKAQKLYERLHELFYTPPQNLPSLSNLKHDNPLDFIDPTKELDRVGLTPIGIVHLFRQYFFEFSTFLGSPVGHVWLSPGATVELIEVSTRRTYTERTTEQFVENIIRTETAVTEQDEISDAVRTDNRVETKFGANVSGNQKWIWGTTNQSASFDLGATQSLARDFVHKHMRQQSQKLATEIRKNFKSTLKVISEITNTSSKRYVLTNNSRKLVNYELRRKMRQVGVQVQDIGTYLCWQTYVDEPGRQLGIAELVHIAKSPDAQLQHPESLSEPAPVEVSTTIEIPFEQTSSDRGDLDEGYRDGHEVDTDLNEGQVETIRADFPQKVTPPQPGYYLDPNFHIDKSGADVQISVRDFKQHDPAGVEPISEVTFTLHLDYVNFKGNSPIRLTTKLKWLPRPSLIKKINEENQARIKDFTEEKAELHRKEYLTAARDRIKLASNIEARKYEDLREEERIVVYRKLIQDMLTNGIAMKDDTTRHAVSELIDSIFDVDKMLYFVAPEWWKPRIHYAQLLGAEPSTQGAKPIIPTVTGKNGVIHSFGKVKAGATKPPMTVIPREHLTNWGGMSDRRDDNYYITEDSQPARLGASLGWLLQLDGDNLRNAFLNAPWVKAIIPIRPGKENAALNWLKHVEGMNGIGENDMYQGHEPDLAGKTVLEALKILSAKVGEKQKAAGVVSSYPLQEADDVNRVSATPVDRVYEHGFYPLHGGFRATPAKGDPKNPDGNFEVFDQWIEVLPTDQIAAVEVQYDPASGQQIDK